MTIKLLVAIQGSGGVVIPAGTEVTLTDAVEAAHVSANKAVYTTRPQTFDAPPASGFFVKQNNFGGIIDTPGVDLIGGLLNSRRRLSTIMQSQIYGSVAAQSQTTNNFCYHMTIVIPCDARKFRVALDNVSTTLPFRIKSGAIATSDSVGADATYGTTTGQVRFTPQNGTAWTPITWDSGVSSVEIAVAPSATRKTRKWSDWISAPTVANADGSKLRVVMLRFWVEGTTSSPGNGYCTGGYPQTWRSLAANTALHGGYIWQCIRSTVDGVTSPANFQPNTDLSGLPFVTTIQYESYIPGITVTVFGDSINAGAVNAGIGNFGNGWVWQYVKLLRTKYPNTPIDLSNESLSGKTSSVYSQAAIDYINNGGVVGFPVYQAFSQNDGTPTSAIVAAQKANRETVEAAIKTATGLKTAISAPCPNTSLAWDATQDGVRLAYRAELLAERVTGTTVYDLECVSNGATPARYVSAWTTDNVHPNEIGCGVIASAAISSGGNIE